MGYYSDDISAGVAKAYKKQEGKYLAFEQIRQLIDQVLLGFSIPTGNPGIWALLLKELKNRIQEDDSCGWRKNGLYCGGKPLDDLIDTIICLATALSYAHGCAHVWQDPDAPDDGHIIGPGYQQRTYWMPA